jgi:hypothetical protein
VLWWLILSALLLKIMKRLSLGGMGECCPPHSILLLSDLSHPPIVCPWV